jgi:hypothetical protein
MFWTLLLRRERRLNQDAKPIGFIDAFLVPAESDSPPGSEEPAKLDDEPAADSAGADRALANATPADAALEAAAEPEKLRLPHSEFDLCFHFRTVSALSVAYMTQNWSVVRFVLFVESEIRMKPMSQVNRMNGEESPIIFTFETARTRCRASYKQ